MDPFEDEMPAPPPPPPTTGAKLKALMDEYSRPVDPFRPGDLVTWKPNCRVGRLPEMGEPAIVSEVLSKPRKEFEPSDPAESYDLICGVYEPYADTIFFYYFSSQRLQHYYGE
jgi:hypothetical protein